MGLQPLQPIDIENVDGRKVRQRPVGFTCDVNLPVRRKRTRTGPLAGQTVSLVGVTVGRTLKIETIRWFLALLLLLPLLLHLFLPLILLLLLLLRLRMLLRLLVLLLWFLVPLVLLLLKLPLRLLLGIYWV